MVDLEPKTKEVLHNGGGTRRSGVGGRSKPLEVFRLENTTSYYS